MARKKTSELMAGTFVILAVAIGLGVVLWLGASDWFRPARHTAYFYVEQSDGRMGLAPGSFVQLNDAEIGKVVEVRPDLDAERTLYVVHIDRKDAAIYSDGTAIVSGDLVGGKRLVVTSRGTPAAPVADETHPIRIAGGLDKAMVDLAAAAEKVDKIAQTVLDELDKSNAEALLAQIHAITGDLRLAAGDIAAITATGRKEFDPRSKTALLGKTHASLDNIKEATANIAAQTDPETQGTIVAHVRGASAGLDAMVADATPKVARTLDSAAGAAELLEGYARKDVAELFAKFRKINTDIAKITADFADVSGNVRQIVALNRENLDEMIDNMLLVTENLKATSKEVRRNPWRLLYQPKDKELRSADLLGAARAYSDGATQLDQAVTKLKALRRIPADDPQLQAAVQAVKKHLKASFDRFKKVEDALWKEMSK